MLPERVAFPSQLPSYDVSGSSFEQATPPYKQATPPYKQATPPYKQAAHPYAQTTPSYDPLTPPYEHAPIANAYEKIHPSQSLQPVDLKPTNNNAILTNC